MTIYELASQFFSQDIATIPLMHRDKRPETSLLPFGKWEPYKTTLPTVANLQHWHNTEWYNYGVVAGWRNLAILDFDNMTEYARWMMWLSRSVEEPTWMKIKYTLAVQTHRGVHIYFRLKNAEHLNNRKFPGIDLKINGYVVGPGSVHPSGDTYTILSNKGRIFLAEFDYLSDILPPAILEQVSTVAAAPMTTPAAEDAAVDPWAVANAPQSTSTGGDLVSAVRERFKIEDFFTLTRTTSSDGRWYLARCPFHDDKDPSLWIDATRGICNCFSCNFPKPLDVIDLYAALYGMDNRTALLTLAAKL